MNWWISSLYLMSRVFDKNIEATELILRIILGRDIKVISVDGQDALTLVCIMSKTALCCESSGNGLDILYSSGIPVAYRIATMDEWHPFTNNWHKEELEEYLGGTK